MSQTATMSDILASVRNMELQRNVHISLRHRYVYFGVPKAANSTIKWLLQNGELANVRYTVDRVHDRKASPLIAPYQLRDEDFMALLADPEYTVFTCVRNPYSRLLSCFLDRVQVTRTVPRRQIAKALDLDVEAEISFEAFIEALTRLTNPVAMNEHYKPQSLLTCFDVVSYDKILAFENLQPELGPLLDELYAGEEIEFPVEENRSPKVTKAGSQVADFVTEDLAAVIQDLYASDFDNFGYSRVVADVGKPPTLP